MVKIAKLIPQWIAESTLRKSTQKRYCYSLAKLVRAGFTRPETVSRAAWRRYAGAERAAGRTARTVNHDLAVLSSFLGWLWDRGEFPLPILLELRELYLETPRPTPDYLTPAQYVALRARARAVRDVLELAVVLAVGTGLRYGELRRLRHEDFACVSESGPFLRIARTEEIKTGKARCVPLHAALVKELTDRWDFTPGRAGPVFPARRRTGELAEIRHAGTMREWLVEAREGIGFYVNWITLRHTFATWHVQAGTSIALVARWLGHSIQVCYDHYCAHAPGGDPAIESGFAGLAGIEGVSEAGGSD